MGCNCNQASSNPCGTLCIQGNNWLVPVTTIPPVELASRKNAYILPDDSIYILNHEGNGMIPLGAAYNCTIEYAEETLPLVEDANPCVIYIQNGNPWILSEDGKEYNRLVNSVTQTGLVKTVNGIGPDKNGNVEVPLLSSGNKVDIFYYINDGDGNVVGYISAFSYTLPSTVTHDVKVENSAIKIDIALSSVFLEKGVSSITWDLVPYYDEKNININGLSSVTFNDVFYNQVNNSMVGIQLNFNTYQKTLTLMVPTPPDSSIGLTGQMNFSGMFYFPTI